MQMRKAINICPSDPHPIQFRMTLTFTFLLHDDLDQAKGLWNNNGRCCSARVFMFCRL